jgi:virulence-associated protein VagC
MYTARNDGRNPTMQRRAKVFMNNRSQAVRLPKEFQFNTDEVFIRKEGEDVILSPRRYMLDTDTCSYIMKRSSETVVKRLRAVPVADVCISVITKSELLYGVEVSPQRTQDDTALQAFLPHVQVDSPRARPDHRTDVHRY